MNSFQNGWYYYNPQEYIAELNAKRALRRAAFAVAVPGIVFFLVAEFWGTALIAVGQGMGFTREKTVAFLSNPAVLQLLQVALSVLFLTVPFVLCAKLFGMNISAEVPIKKPESENNSAYFFLGVGFCAFANIATSLAGEIFKRFGIDYSVPEEKTPEGFFGFMLVLISTVAVPALVEEFAFRGIVQGLLKPFGEVFSIFASAAVFGIFHGNFEQIVFAFFVGLILGLIRIKTNSLLICMAVHGVNNLVAVISSYSLSVPAVLENIIYIVYIMLALTFAILGVALLKDNENFTFETQKSVLGLKKTYINFFFSPAFIIFCLLFFFRAVIYFFK